jgi:hypothetical protein
MFCPNCGFSMAPGAIVCGGCGWREVQSQSTENDPAMRLLLPVGRSVYSIIAGYLGLVSPLVCTAPFAIIFGVLALLDLKKRPELSGRGRAIFGIVMGTIFTLIPLIVILASAVTS